MCVSGFMNSAAYLFFSASVFLILKVHVNWSAEVGRLFEIPFVFYEEGIIDFCVIGENVF